MSVAVFLHLLAACIWAGGLIFLGLAAGVARGTLGERERIDAGDDKAEAELRRLAPLAAAVQGVMLLGTLAVLGLAAALVS